MSLAKSTAVFASGTLISRVTGLLRDRIMLSVLGASEAHSAFIIANRIPNLLRELVSEGALSNSFTKVYTAISVEDERRGSRLLADSLVLVGGLGIVITLLGMLTAPWLVDLSMYLADKGDYSTDFFDQTTTLTRLLFPFIMLMSIASIAMGALYKRGEFFVTSMAPILLNIGYIIGALVFANFFANSGRQITDLLSVDPIALGVAIGVLVGGFGQMSIQLFALWRPVLSEAGLFKLRLPWNNDLKKIFILMGPMVIATSAGPINAQVNLIFAAGIGDGALVWLNYSFRLLQLPIGLFGVAVGAAALPSLSRLIAANHGQVDKAASRQFQNAIQLVMWLMGPSMLFLMVGHEPLIRLLYESGKFSGADVSKTADTLFVYSFGLLGYGLIKVLTSFYYATDRTSYPMYVSLGMILVNFVANMVFVKELGHLGVAAATALTLSGNALFLFLGLRGRGITWETKEAIRSTLYLAGGAIFAWSAGTRVLAYTYELLAGSNHFLREGFATLLTGTIVMAVFGGAALVAWRTTPKEGLALLKSQLRRKK